MVTLTQIKEALENLEHVGFNSLALVHLNDAMDDLHMLGEELDNITVCGRENIDALLGCMIGLEMIIGEKKEVDEDG